MAKRDDDTSDRYLRLAELSAYSTLSLRTLQRCLHNPQHPLPSHRFGRTIMVKRSDYDRWLVDEQRRRAPRTAPAGELTKAQRAALDLAGYPRPD